MPGLPVSGTGRSRPCRCLRRRHNMYPRRCCRRCPNRAPSGRRLHTHQAKIAFLPPTVEVAVCACVHFCTTGTYRCSVRALLLSTPRPEGVCLPGFRPAPGASRKRAVEAWSIVCGKRKGGDTYPCRPRDSSSNVHLAEVRLAFSNKRVASDA